MPSTTMQRSMRKTVAVFMALLFSLCVLMPGLRASALIAPLGKTEMSVIPYDATITSTKEQWKALAIRESEEGSVLLKNKNGVLPIDTSRGKVKVNLFGYCAYHPVYSGAGSGATSSAGAVDFKQSLASGGFEINPAIEKIYAGADNSSDGGLIGTVAATFISSFNQNEIPVTSFTGNASFENMKQYSDTAIFVIGRNAGEGNDLSNYSSKDGRRYLQLSVNEENVLKQARNTFKNLIVLINAGNALEMGELNAIGPDAILQLGIPSQYGLARVGALLNGTANPSGRLTSTWVYDNDANPTSENFGKLPASNARGTFYVDYVENIYNGYKYYETAAAEKAVITNTKNGKTYDFRNYGSVVAYPFGYGLSYTSFDQELKDVPKHIKPGDNFNVKVKVTNTGDRAGKEVVQLYVKVPYTAYDKAHGVEKAEVALVGAAKTKTLAPGKSETVKIPVCVEDLASYDMSYQNANGKKGAYRLDAGDYEFSIRKNAHTAIASETATLKEDKVFTGKDKRSTDDQQAYNQFDDVARGKYLSRKNAFANYTEAMNSVENKAKDLSYQKDPDGWAKKRYDSVVTKHYVKGIDYARKGDLKYTDMRGKSYEDPKWDDVVAQLTIPELCNLVRVGMYNTAAAPSVGKPMTLDSDGPQGLIANIAKSTTGEEAIAYPGVHMLAQTWDQDLAYTYGSYIADEFHAHGVTSWYAPAMDNQRNAYSGRNYEYYSEDAVLSGLLAQAETLAARKKGMIVFIKHYALNDQETNRAGNLHTYSNEQAIREIYLKPFEMCVKNAHANAVMGGCNMIGDVFCNASVALNDEVLRNEWGFRGQVSTDQSGWGMQTNVGDYVGPTGYWLHTDAIIRGGTDNWLDFKIGNLKMPSTATDADIFYLQKAAKNILFTEANAYVIPTDLTFISAFVGGLLK